MFRRGLAYLHLEIDWAAIVGSVLALAFCLLALVPIATGTENTQEPAQQQATATADAYGIPPELPEETFWQRTLDDPVASYTLVLAIFTIVLSVSTVGLWLKTDRLAKGSEETARRQLRAYVSVSANRLFAFNAGKPVSIRYTMHNHGQTPAHDLRSFAAIELWPHPIPDDWDDFGSPEGLKPTSRSVLFPGAEGKKIATCTAQRTFTAAELAAAIDGKASRIFLLVKVYYVDAFGIERETRICVHAGGPEIEPMSRGIMDTAEGVTFTAIAQHNDAT